MGKRIAIVIDSLVGGGAEKVMLVLANTLQSMGHEPHLILLKSDCDHFVPQSLPIHSCFAEHEKNLDSFWKVSASAKKLEAFIHQVQSEVGQFDLFISNLDKANVLMARSKLENVYFVVHNSIEEELTRARKLGPFNYWNMWKAKTCLSGKDLITVSDGIAKEIKEVGRIQPASVQTIYNPFDLEKIKQLSLVENELIPEQEYMIHVGRCAKQKRHDILFQALAQMTNKLPIVLLCKNKKKALKLAKKYGVEERIIIPGFQENPYPWVKNAKLMVLSSDYEGLPTVLIESLAVGTPVVSTDCRHGPNEILTGKFAQYMVPRRNPTKLAQKVDFALAQYPDCSDADILEKVQAKTVAEQYIRLVK